MPLSSLTMYRHPIRDGASPPCFDEMKERTKTSLSCVLHTILTAVSPASGSWGLYGVLLAAKTPPMVSLTPGPSCPKLSLVAAAIFDILSHMLAQWTLFPFLPTKARTCGGILTFIRSETIEREGRILSSRYDEVTGRHTGVHSFD